MAKHISIEKKELDIYGFLPVRIGDTKNLSIQILEGIGREALPVDLTGVGVTGFLPAASGGGLPVIGTVTCENKGFVEFALSSSYTSALQTNVQGTTFYARLGDASSYETVETQFSQLQILEPGFRTL